MDPRPRLALTLLALLLGAPVASADWLQEGGNAARKSVAEGAGPATDDVALVVQLPPNCNPDEPPLAPLVVRGKAYVVDSDDVACEGRSHLYVFEVDLVTGATRPVVERDGSVEFVMPPALVSDGERAYLSASLGDVIAYDLGSWEEVWSVRVDPLPSSPSLPGGVAQCGLPALRDGLLYLACSREGGFGAAADTLGLALDTKDGALAWRWQRGAAARSAPPATGDPVRDANLLFTDAERAPVPGVVDPLTVSVIGPWVVVGESSTSRIGQTDGPYFSTSYYGVNATTGAYGWRVGDSFGALNDVGALANRAPPALGDEEWVFFEMSQIRRAPTAGPDRWEQQEFRDERYEGDPGSGIALAGDALYLTSLRELIRADRALALDWTFELPADEAWGTGAPVVAGDRVYAMAEGKGRRSVLYALDARSGTLVFRHELEAPAAFSVSDGVALVFDARKVLTLLGTSSTSPVARAATSLAYPQPGDLIVVDLSGSEAGAQGPPTEYRADWGDGTVTEWNATPRMEHRYDTPADREARFFVRNDAGQTASVVVPFYVGRPPPLNPMQRAFSSENQERTFFVLGLLVTSAAGLAGVWRLRRSRSIVQRELAAIEQAYAMTRDRPADCQSALTERRTHCRALFLDGRLDEAQFSLLARQIDDLMGQSRLGRLEDEFGFLPIAMARSLENILADGRVTRWERRTFLDALAQDTIMSAEQKERVRTLVDEWFARDAGGSRVDHALDFLPHRHVRALREMLADGRITSLERAHFLALLDADTTLPGDYKARVRAVVDGWAAHDQGARP